MDIKTENKTTYKVGETYVIVHEDSKISAYGGRNPFPNTGMTLEEAETLWTLLGKALEDLKKGK